MIDTFRDRLPGELTELIPQTAEPTPSRPRRHRRLILAAAAATATALGAALVLDTLGGPNGSTSAWAVEPGKDGEVLVSLHEIDDPSRLQRDLRAAGVPAVVRPISATCTHWTTQSQPEKSGVLRENVERPNGEHFWRINPRALKPGQFLAFLVTHRTGTLGDAGSYESWAFSIIVAATDDPRCA